MKKFTILLCILMAGVVYSAADAQTYAATISQQQAINNATRIENLANVLKAMEINQNNRLTTTEDKLSKIESCSASNKIYNPAGIDLDSLDCATVDKPIQQNDCQWIATHCMNSPCSSGSLYASTCPAGKYVAGFRQYTAGEYATANQQIKCCSLQ